MAAGDARVFSRSNPQPAVVGESKGSRSPASPVRAGEPERYSTNSRSASVSGLAFLPIRCRTVEQPLWLKQDFHRGGHVCRGGRLNHWKKPPLILHPGGNTENGWHPV